MIYKTQHVYVHKKSMGLIMDIKICMLIDGVNECNILH